MPPPLTGTTMWAREIASVESDILMYDVSVNRAVDKIGIVNTTKIIAIVRQYFSYYLYLRSLRARPVVVIPLSQSKLGFLRDSIYIYIADRIRCPVVVYLHGSEFKDVVIRSNAAWAKYVGYILSKTKGAVVLGEKLRSNFERWYHQSRIYVIENGLSNVGVEERNNQTDRKNPSLLSVSNMMKRKGIIDVMAAYKIARDAGADISIDIAGAKVDQEVYRTVENITKSYSNARYHGIVDGVQKKMLFANADIFVFTPILPEGMPYVLIEAMMHGLAIISTDQGAITESVQHMRNGVIVQTNNPESIAEAIMMLASNADILRRMKIESVAVYQEKHTIEKMIKKLHSVAHAVVHS